MGLVIGAGSVVTRTVPPFAVVVGAPARIVRQRFSEEVIQRLTALEWWNWPEERISRNADLFQADLTSGDATSTIARSR